MVRALAFGSLFLSGIASAASFIPNSNDLSRQLADQNQAYVVNQQQRMQFGQQFFNRTEAFHLQSVLTQQARTRAQSFELRTTSQIRDEELGMGGNVLNEAKPMRRMRKSAGALPSKIFMRTAAPARREPLRYRSRRVGGIVSRLGNSSGSFSFGRGFQPGAGDRSFQFGDLTKGAPSFELRGLGK